MGSDTSGCGVVCVTCRAGKKGQSYRSRQLRDNEEKQWESQQQSFATAAYGLTVRMLLLLEGWTTHEQGSGLQLACDSAMTATTREF